MSTKLIVCISLLLALCYSGASLSYAKNAKNRPHAPYKVAGQITDTRPNEIKVNGSFYDLRGARLLTKTGRIPTVQDLAPGRVVEIHFKGDMIRDIVIDDVYRVK